MTSKQTRRCKRRILHARVCFAGVLIGLALQAGSCSRNADQGQEEQHQLARAEIKPQPRQPEPAVQQPQDPEPKTLPNCGTDVMPDATASAGWGNLRVRFVYDGDRPERKPLKITADIDFCSKQHLLEEGLIVHPKNRGVANVVAWLYLARGDTMPAVHPSYAETETAEVTLDAEGCRFEPHVCLLRTTQTLLIRNRNPIGDSAKIDTFYNPPLNITLAIDSQEPHPFPTAERLPARVSCSVHPWESGWLLVKEHPYMGVSNEAGGLEIRNLPAGKWTFQFWHEKSRYIDQVAIEGEPTSWKRGRVQIDIQVGDNDLGEVLLAPPLFAN